MNLSEPIWTPLPPANTSIIMLGEIHEMIGLFPDKETQSAGRVRLDWWRRRREFYITTPSEVTVQWLKHTVQFWMGWDYKGWIYA